MTLRRFSRPIGPSGIRPFSTLLSTHLSEKQYIPPVEAVKEDFPAGMGASQRPALEAGPDPRRQILDLGNAAAPKAHCAGRMEKAVAVLAVLEPQHAVDAGCPEELVFRGELGQWTHDGLYVTQRGRRSSY